MTEFSETSKKALEIIKKHKKGVVISELAKRLGVAKSNFGSRHLKPLREAGLITKSFKIGKDFYVKSTGKKLKEVEKAAEKEPKPKGKYEKLEEEIKAKEKAIEAKKKELTKPEKKAKIKEAKEGLTNGKYANWYKKQEFQKLPLRWFQHRPTQAARFLRYLINIGISGSERYKIKKTFGGMSNYRAIMNQLISFLEQ